jgi:hypothetical protein
MHKENVSTSSGSSTYNASTRWVLESKLRQIYAVAGPSWSSPVEAVEFGILSNDVGVDSELKKTEKKKMMITAPWPKRGQFRKQKE